MLKYKIKIGLAPMRRNTTNRPAKTFLTWVSAEERGHRFVEYIEKNFTSEYVEFVNINGIGCNDLMFDDESAAKVVERFTSEKVDAVLVINCNFGNEEAAADMANQVTGLIQKHIIARPTEDSQKMALRSSVGREKVGHIKNNA